MVAPSLEGLKGAWAPSGSGGVLSNRPLVPQPIIPASSSAPHLSAGRMAGCCIHCKHLSIWSSFSLIFCWRDKAATFLMEGSARTAIVRRPGSLVRAGAHWTSDSLSTLQFSACSLSVFERRVTRSTRSFVSTNCLSHCEIPLQHPSSSSVPLINDPCLFSSL